MLCVCKNHWSFYFFFPWSVDFWLDRFSVKIKYFFQHCNHWTPNLAFLAAHEIFELLLVTTIHKWYFLNHLRQMSFSRCNFVFDCLCWSLEVGSPFAEVVCCLLTSVSPLNKKNELCRTGRIKNIKASVITESEVRLQVLISSVLSLACLCS